MEFVIPDESFDNSNDPLQVQASLFYSIPCSKILCTVTAKLHRLFYYGQNPQTHTRIHKFNIAYVKYVQIKKSYIPIAYFTIRSKSTNSHHTAQIKYVEGKKIGLSFIFRVHI